MFFGQDILGEEGFEIIEKSWEKFVCFWEKIGKDGYISIKAGHLLKKIWQNSAFFAFFGKKFFKSDFGIR